MNLTLQLSIGIFLELFLDDGKHNKIIYLAYRTELTT